MQTCRGEIEDKVLRARCLSRVSKMSTIAKKYHRTLHPHDFYLSVDDVCRFPDIRKAIIGGTDEEFNTCAEGVISGLPRLTSQSLEKRAAKISALLPSDERPDNVLSLATTWFECGSCNPSLLHGTKALGHQCHILRSWPPDGPVGEVTFDIHVGRGWCAETSKFTFSKVASAIARELIIGCGEDPESITLAEMNSKAHRFAVYENGALVARNWRETVCSTGSPGVRCRGLTTRYAPSSSITNIVPPLCTIDPLDRKSFQSLCTIPTPIMRKCCGTVSFVGDVMGAVFSGSHVSRRSP